jgi:hypothetical protein
MATEIPVVRHFVACEAVVVDPDPASRKATLRNVFHAIVRRPGEPFPCICEAMALYALLANGRGEHEFAVELTFFDRGEERSLHRSQARPLDLGQDPSVVHGLPMALRNVTFNEPGQYTFYLLCDGQRIAQEQVEVR